MDARVTCLAESQSPKWKRSEGSGADVAGVEGARHGGIPGALENGTTVGEDGHFIRRDGEAEQKIVLADAVDEGLQAGLENAEVRTW